VSQFDATFRTLFESFGLSAQQTSAALHIATKYDLTRMTDDQIRASDHVSSRDTTKWRKYFREVHKETFKRRFGDALVRLGYETSNDW